jgi:hypothetical protein
MAVSKISKKEEEFIDGKKTSKKKKEVQAIILRVPLNLLNKIDQVIDKRDINVSRNTWILEAIHRYL